MVVRAFPGTRLEPDMLNKGKSREELAKYKQFSGEGTIIKYHVMNISSLNGMSPNSRVQDSDICHQLFYTIK